MSRTRLIVVGGFLGAGKTTLLMTAAQELRRRGHRVCVVVNDQSADLVDAALLQSFGVTVGEVAGGCFCCRLPDLVDVIGRVRQSVDVILAEPVGSCTDLVATVLRPLGKEHAHGLDIAPLSVVVDPRRFASIANERIRYLYERQLVEADVVVVNKSDLVSESESRHALEPLDAAMEGAKVARVSALTGAGIDAWLDAVLDGRHASDRDLELDYDMYAEAEACLAWLNARGTITGAASARGVKEWMEALLDTVRTRCADEGMQIAHAKLLVRDGGNGVSKAALADDTSPISWDPDVSSGVSAEAFVFNVRADGPPDALERIVRDALERANETGLNGGVSRLVCFSPPRPTPFHRLNAAAVALRIAPPA
jgi:G3E family GTPase